MIVFSSNTIEEGRYTQGANSSQGCAAILIFCYTNRLPFLKDASSLGRKIEKKAGKNIDNR
jgi:hypothetical protein